MTTFLNVEELKTFCRDKKIVYWHPEWIKVRKHLGEIFYSGQSEVIIMKVWEDNLHPDIVGISFKCHRKPGYIAIRRDGKALSTELNYPVFTGAV